jgi:hypothetical protein
MFEATIVIKVKFADKTSEEEAQTECQSFEKLSRIYWKPVLAPEGMIVESTVAEVSQHKSNGKH